MSKAEETVFEPTRTMREQRSRTCSVSSWLQRRARVERSLTVSFHAVIASFENKNDPASLKVRMKTAYVFEQLGQRQEALDLVNGGSSLLRLLPSSCSAAEATLLTPARFPFLQFLPSDAPSPSPEVAKGRLITRSRSTRPAPSLTEVLALLAPKSRLGSTGTRSKI